MSRKICFITGSRAEYGLLKSLILEAINSKLVRSQVLVTGSHLSKQHGMTINEIKQDGIKIDSLVNLNIKEVFISFCLNCIL